MSHFGLFCLLNSWKWKMKIQSMCFNNRREAWFNQPHAPPSSLLNTNNLSGLWCTAAASLQFVLLSRQNSTQKKLSFLSATHNCCIVFSSTPLILLFFLYINHMEVTLSSGFVCSCCIVINVRTSLPSLKGLFLRLQADRAVDRVEWINKADFTGQMSLGLAWSVSSKSGLKVYYFGTSFHWVNGMSSLGLGLDCHLCLCPLQKSIWFYTFFI